MLWCGGGVGEVVVLWCGVGGGGGGGGGHVVVRGEWGRWSCCGGGGGGEVLVLWCVRAIHLVCPELCPPLPLNCSMLVCPPLPPLPLPF